MAIGNPIVLSVRNLTKTYRAAGEQIAVLRGVNLSVAAGERVALSGESGSGKSTLLHLIAGLDRPDGGEIRLADTSVSDLTDALRANKGVEGIRVRSCVVSALGRIGKSASAAISPLVDQAFETGPGRVLSGLIKRISPEAEVHVTDARDSRLWLPGRQDEASA